MPKISDQDKIAFADAVLASIEAAAIAAATMPGVMPKTDHQVSLTFDVTLEDPPSEDPEDPSRQKPQWKPVVCCMCVMDPFDNRRCAGDCCP